MQFQKWRARQADGKAQNAISQKIGPIRPEMPAFFQMDPMVIGEQFHMVDLRSGGSRFWEPLREDKSGRHSDKKTFHIVLMVL